MGYAPGRTAGEASRAAVVAGRLSWVAAGLLAVATVAVVAGSPVPGPASAALAGGAAVTVVVAGVALVWRRRVDSGRSGRAWLLLCLAGCVVGIGVAVSAAPNVPAHVALDSGYFLGCPLFAVAVLMLPTPVTRDRWEAVLDVFDGVTAGLGTAVATLWLVPAGSQTRLGPEELAHVAATTATVAVLVYAVTRQRRPGGVPLRQLELVLLAAALVTAGSVLAYRAAADSSGGEELLAGVLLVCGCLTGVQAVFRDPKEWEGPQQAAAREAWATVLPVVPIGLGLLCLAWYAVQPDPMPLVLGSPMIAFVYALIVALLALRVLLDGQARRLRALAGRQEAEAATQAAWFRTMTANTTDAILLVDPLDRVVVSSPAAERLLGSDRAGVAGASLADFLLLDPGQWRRILSQASYLGGSPVVRDLSVRDATGQFPCEARVSALTGGAGVQGFVVTLHDLTERYALSRALAEQQATDGLTGLRNRAGFIADAAQHLARAEPGRAAVVVIDLERFGIVNDAVGHAAGDDLLRRAAALVAACAECGGVCLGRVGGDEFAILVLLADPGADIDAHLRASAAHLRERFAGIAHLRGDGLPMGTHIGYAVLDEAGQHADDLLGRAEVAMATARVREGRDPVRFDAIAHAARLAEFGLEADLRRAIPGGELVLHYQPVLELAGDRVVGVEALLRWHHPTFGMMGPDRFVPLAERCGLSRDLGRWVLSRALADLPTLRSALGDDVGVAVNVSAQEVRAGLPEDVAAAVRHAGVAPSLLTLEVTETALFAFPDLADATLRAVRAAGVRVALDDFGTGYSSLALLTRVPADVLKVDRTFVAGIIDDARQRALVEAVLRLCASLGLRSVAEGVETVQQERMLRDLGCDEVQGFLYSRPLPLAEVCTWVTRRRSSASTLPG